MGVEVSDTCCINYLNNSVVHVLGISATYAG